MSCIAKCCSYLYRCCLSYSQNSTTKETDLVQVKHPKQMVLHQDQGDRKERKYNFDRRVYYTPSVGNERVLDTDEAAIKAFQDYLVSDQATGFNLLIDTEAGRVKAYTESGANFSLYHRPEELLGKRCRFFMGTGSSKTSDFFIKRLRATMQLTARGVVVLSDQSLQVDGECVQHKICANFKARFVFITNKQILRINRVERLTKSHNNVVRNSKALSPNRVLIAEKGNKLRYIVLNIAPMKNGLEVGEALEVHISP